MDLDELLRLCEAYGNLGWAVQAQFQSVMGGDPIKDQNPSAMKMVREFLEKCRRAHIDGAFDLINKIDLVLLATDQDSAPDPDF